MSDLYLVWKNLYRKRVRLILMLLAIMVAFVLYALIGSLNQILNGPQDVSSANRFIVANKINFTSPLPYAYYNRVKQVEGVAAVTTWNWFGGYYQELENNFPMFAVDQDSLFDVYPDIVLSDAEREAFLGNRQALIVGEQTALQYGWSVGDRIPIASNIFYREDGSSGWEFDVAGIYVGKDPSFSTREIYFHYDYFNEGKSSRFGRDNIGLMVLLTESLEVNDSVIKAIDTQFANSFAETETVTEQAFSAQFVEQLGDITLIITSVVGAAFFVILIIVGNSMALAIKERTAEIAVLKTLGFGRLRICGQVLAESTLLALIGGTLGFLVAKLSLGLLAPIFNGANFPLPSITDPIIAQGVIYMMVLGFLTGIIPAIGALRISLLRAFQKV